MPRGRPPLPQVGFPRTCPQLVRHQCQAPCFCLLRQLWPIVPEEVRAIEPREGQVSVPVRSWKGFVSAPLLAARRDTSSSLDRLLGRRQLGDDHVKGRHTDLVSATTGSPGPLPPDGASAYLPARPTCPPFRQRHILSCLAHSSLLLPARPSQAAAGRRNIYR
ncbi:hypothetical protein E2C01_066021 [Portunus trituberculatus]|uniref:Uncharacterized protein n=1 Tax=Portunus trituberculatus TaxID=210409 RepID=A0A5B7HPZ8_PORTR|nr:hypothetical protein [Portunus trituberculatus]